MFYYDPTYIILLPAIILALFAQSRVQSTYRKFSQVASRRGMTGAAVARMILDRNGLSKIRIERTPGELSDHFDPRQNVVRLSEGVHDSTSIAAIGIAAHEVGHALQHSCGYIPIKLRNSIVPVAQIASGLAFPLILLGIFISSFSALIPIGILLYTAVVLFQVITLPVEFNASHRAIETVYQLGCLDEDETKNAKKVLSAAALTYVAAAASAILQLLRLMTIAGNGRRRD